MESVTVAGRASAACKHRAGTTRVQRGAREAQRGGEREAGAARLHRPRERVEPRRPARGTDGGARERPGGRRQPRQPSPETRDAERRRAPRTRRGCAAPPPRRSPAHEQRRASRPSATTAQTPSSAARHRRQRRGVVRSSVGSAAPRAKPRSETDAQRPQHRDEHPRVVGGEQERRAGRARRPASPHGDRPRPAGRAACNAQQPHRLSSPPAGRPGRPRREPGPRAPAGSPTSHPDTARPANQSSCPTEISRGQLRRADPLADGGQQEHCVGVTGRPAAEHGGHGRPPEQRQRGGHRRGRGGVRARARRRPRPAPREWRRRPSPPTRRRSRSPRSAPNSEQQRRRARRARSIRLRGRRDARTAGRRRRSSRPRGGAARPRRATRPRRERTGTRSTWRRAARAARVVQPWPPQARRGPAAPSTRTVSASTGAGPRRRSMASIRAVMTGTPASGTPAAAPCSRARPRWPRCRSAASRGRLELADRAAEDQAAALDQDRVVAGRRDVLDQVGRDDDAGVARRARAAACGSDALLGVEAGGRLVEQQDPRVVDDRLRDPDAAHHPAGERLQPAVGPVAEPDPVDRALDRAGIASPGISLSQARYSTNSRAV